ncbi:putative glutamine amidotransferase YafJ [subsurface metagenome]
MCELLLIVANRKVGIDLSWKALQDRAKQNPDGWGAAWLDGGTFTSKRKPEKLPGGAKGMRLVTGITTSQFLAHVRYRVTGTVALQNTQPFISPDNKYAFAATMSQCKVLARYKKSVRQYLKGRTGTEVLFQVFLNKYNRNIGNLNPLSGLIEEVFVESNLKKRASASFVLMSPAGIWAYRYRKSLYYLVRKPPHEAEVTLLSRKGYKTKLSSKKNSKDMVTLLASEKLTNENWRLLPDKTLVEVTHKGAQAGA